MTKVSVVANEQAEEKVFLLPGGCSAKQGWTELQSSNDMGHSGNQGSGKLRLDSFQVVHTNDVGPPLLQLQLTG